MRTSENRKVDLCGREVSVTVDYGPDESGAPVVVGVTAPALSVDEHAALLGALGISADVPPELAAATTPDDPPPEAPPTTPPKATRPTQKAGS